MLKLLSIATLSSALLFGTTSAVAASTYAKTKYPIVLAHGMGGFNKLGPVDYWYGMPSDLKANGASVYVTSMAAFQSSVYRGEQLLKQTQDILALSGAAKVNLISHSHGNTAVRYVAGLIPQKIASVTSIAGPVKGSPVADMLQQTSQLPLIGAPATTVIASIVNGLGSFIGLAQGQSIPQDALAGMKDLTIAGSAAFNTTFSAGVPRSACGEGDYVVDGVRYYSWSGTGVLTNPLDVMDMQLGLSSLAFIGKTDAQNDGLVGRCSSHLGKVVRDNYFMNHGDEVNQLFGLTSIFETSPIAVLRQTVNRLKVAGL